VRSFFGKVSYGLCLREKRYAGASASLFFALVIVILYRHVLDSFWLYDDPYLLKNAISHGAWSFFVSPDIWHKVSLRNLAPWEIVSYKIDYSLFGLNQHFFYLHQLLSLWLVSIALYKLMRLWVKPFFAACGSLFFLVSAPVAACTEMLMTRHYIEGLFFCLVSFYFFIRSVREDSLLYSIAAATVYFLSMSAKELYVPLAVVFFFLPEGELRKRIVRAVPSGAVMVLYFLWRHYMLGDFTTGRGGVGLFGSYKGLSSIGLFLKNIYGTVTMVTGVSPFGKFLAPLLGGIVLVLIALSVSMLLKEKNYGWLIFHIFLTGCVYVIPLSVISPYYEAATFTSYRIVILIAAYISALTALCLQFLHRKFQGRAARTLTVVFAACIAVTILAGSLVWITKERKATLAPLVAEGKFFMSADSKYLLVKSNPVWPGTYYYQYLEAFSKKRTGKSPPLVVYRSFAFLNDLVPAQLKGLRVVTYDADTGAMADITRSYAKERSKFFSRLRTLPLAVRLDIDRGAMSYSLGPADSGNYFILAGYKPQTYCMEAPIGKRSGTVNVNTILQVYARFGWQSPQGFVTLSPEWFLDFSKTREIRWSR
jgi:hypothetical protein